MVKQLQDSHQQPLPCEDDILPNISAPTTSAPSTSSRPQKKFVMIYHDESIFNTNEGQTWMWGTDDKPAILPKTKGLGIMVSDFIEQHGGFLRLTSQERHANAIEADPDFPKEARQFLEYGGEREGYWTSQRFMDQMIKAVKIAELKYNKTELTLVWIFDQSSCHKAFAPDALNVNKMNVLPGGAQAKLRDTMWAGNLQQMVFNLAVPKGMKRVLEERGINTATLRGDDMQKILANHKDLKNEKTIIESFLTDKGHVALFLPKFHCELNPIERVWGEAKRYSRTYTNFTLQRLRNQLPDALDSVSTTTIRKYVRKGRYDERAYAEGHHAGSEVERAVRLYKSHRRVFQNCFKFFTYICLYLFCIKYFKICLVDVLYLIFHYL